jgi:hypothetical protein
MKQKDLESEIRELEAKCVHFVKAYAAQQAKGNSGVPAVTIEASFYARFGNPFSAALAVIATKKRDAEIVKRQEMMQDEIRAD